MGGTTLVLGGGGARGMAHVGAWRALQEAGIAPDAVVGTSAGALLGTCVAAGLGWEEILRRAGSMAGRRVFSLNTRVLWDAARQTSIFRGEPLRALIRTLVPARSFAELGLPLSVNAVNLRTGEVEWFGAGGRMDVSVADAVSASCALPLCFPPAVVDGEEYVDGGMRDWLPVGRALAAAPRRVIAVELASAAAAPAGLAGVYARVFEMMARAAAPGAAANPGAVPVLYVRPRVGGYSGFDFSAATALVEEGYRATRETLDAGLVRLPPLRMVAPAVGA